MAITRPLSRYHGGKWRLAPWIISFFPFHRIYVEPFGGMASVLIQKPRAYAEVINDIDSDVVNLFRVLREPEQARELIRLLRLTPFARTELELAMTVCDEQQPVERARRLLVRGGMGFGVVTRGRMGFRGNVRRPYSIPAHDWGHYPEHLIKLLPRLTGVVIENLPALEVIQRYDDSETLFYVDPPYLAESRASARSRYNHEMLDPGKHQELAELLRNVRGMVIVSGYESALYDELYAGWERHSKLARTNGGGQAIEVLWLNQAASERRFPLFMEAR